MGEGTWWLGDGDVAAAVTRLAKAGEPGALLRIELSQAWLTEAKASGLDPAEESGLLRRAWDASASVLPRGTVGKRTLWTRFEHAVPGIPDALIVLGRKLVAALTLAAQRLDCRWHVVFIEVKKGEAARALRCDPGYDLRRLENKSALVWAVPYAGIDWERPGRSPRVTVVWSATPTSTRLQRL